MRKPMQTKYRCDLYILGWLSIQKLLEVAGEPRPVRFALGAKLDDLSGPDNVYEGYSPVGIQFLDSGGEASVLSTAPDEEKRGCIFTCGGDTFLWVRQDELQILELVPHQYRLAFIEG